MSEIKLLPCPFCGGKAHKRIAFPCDADGMEMNLYIVGCDTCDIQFSWLWDEEVAMELWNTRKPMDRIVEELEEYRGMVTIQARGFVKTAINIVKEGGENENR